MNKLSILFLILGLLLSGCGASKPRVVVKKKELPAWYVNPPKSNAYELFALGEGQNQQEAITNALSSVIATLSVSISSSFHAKTVVKEGSVNSSEATYINDAKSDVKTIRISEYEVLHVKKLGFKRYAAVVKVNRQKLFEGLKSEMDQKLEMYQNDSKNIQGLDALKQLAYYENMKNSFAYMQNALIVMKVLNKNFDDKKYIEFMNEMSQKHQYLLEHISFWVISNVKGLDKPVVSALTKKKFGIRNVTSSMHYDVHVNAKIQKANAYGFTLARSEITFTTKNYKGQVVASNVLHVTGQSSQGYAVAKQNLVKRLNDLIEKEGISKVLNLDI